VNNISREQASPNGATLIKPGASPQATQASPNGAKLIQASPNGATLIKPGAPPLE